MGESRLGSWGIAGPGGGRGCSRFCAGVIGAVVLALALVPGHAAGRTAAEDGKRICAGDASREVAGPCAAAAEDLRPRWQDFSDTGRFYFYFQTGHSFLLDETFTGSARLNVPGGYNTMMGGGGGFNITDHWGIEFQAVGTEPDIRMAVRGKIMELSNITMLPAVRFRYPMQNGRLVPYVLAGIGYSLSDINDTADLQVKVSMDEKSIVGSLGVGVEYFVTPHVAAGISAQYFSYPSAETRVTVTPTGVTERGSVDMDSFALLAHLRFFPGETRADARAAGGGRQHLLLARRGPFDTDAFRPYIYALGGAMFALDNQFALDVTTEKPGSVDWLLGGGLGFNISRHWGFEVQLFTTEPNLDGNPAFGSGQRGGKVAELANLSVLPGFRYRWQFWDGRLVPYVSAHLGGAFNQVGDKRLTGGRVRVQDTSIAGAIVTGAEYFLNSHLSLGVMVPYYFYPDWPAFVERRRGSDTGPVVGRAHSTTNFSGPAILFQIKAYLM